MKLALFIDVDGVLTVEPINLQLARMMEVEKDLLDVEQQYAAGQIDNDQFNNKFIPLFRGKEFTQQFVDEHFADLRMRINYEDLLQLNLDTYLVSSGPSYFMDLLAKKCSVPPDRVLCSRYVFDGDGLLSQCIAPVSGQGKGDFVNKHMQGYDLTIGIGDKPAQDAAFLGNCDIRILMGEFLLGYLSVREIESVIRLIRKIQQSAAKIDPAPTDPAIMRVEKEHQWGVERILMKSPYDKNVFIITPFRDQATYRELIRTIKEELEKLGFRGWVASDLNLDDQLWTSVQCYLLGCKYGVAIFTQEQETHRIANADATYNPNVSIEVGYMLSRGKSLLLLKDKGLKQLPTDMLGRLYEDFDLNQAPTSIPAIVQKWVQGL